MDMTFRIKEYFFMEAIKSIRRNGLMSIASISTVAVALLVLSMFLVMVLNVNHMTETIESQVQISVYMEDTATQEQLEATNKKIAALQGVTKVTFINKKQALDEFRKRLGEQQTLLESLGETNPLPNSFDVHVDKPENLKLVAAHINTLDLVESTRFGQETIEPLFKFTYIVRVAGVVLIVFLTFATLFIIANTIRLTVFARRKEVSIMKYVGATDSFIRWPFVIEGMLLGLFGAILSCILVNIVYSISVTQIHASLAFLPILPKQPLMTIITCVTVVLGMVIGAAGSCISLKKFLRV